MIDTWDSRRQGREAHSGRNVRRSPALRAEDRPMPGLYAAGELVGGLFYHNYAGGSGLMAGSVFGRIAGESAARAAVGRAAAGSRAGAR